MTISNSIKSLLLTAAVASAAIVPLANSASARDFDRGGRDFGGNRYDYDRGDRGRGDYRPGPRNYDRDWGGRRRHEGRNVAIGAFAAILGLAIAAEAGRRHYDRYDDRY